MNDSVVSIWSQVFLTYATKSWEKCILSSGNFVIFEVWLVNNWLMNVAETFTDILKYYVLQITDIFKVCVVKS